MFRLTGSDALGLVEAYNSIYEPQELTEEQVWEEVEDWVNALVEEGYDVSEYTWDEMFEIYMDEAVRGAGRSIVNRITGNDIESVKRGDKEVYKKPGWQRSTELHLSKDSHERSQRRRGEKENENDRRERENADDNVSRNRRPSERTRPTGRRLRDRARNR